MKQYISILTVFVFIIFAAACSSNDDSNPTNTTPDPPASVGTYSGNNSMDTTMTVTISNIDGKAYVTRYYIAYKTSNGGNGKLERNLGQGLAEVVNNAFEISLGAEADEKLTGAISGSTMTGSFKNPSLPFVGVVSGTYSISK